LFGQFLEEGKMLSVELEKKERAIAPCLIDKLWFNGHDEVAWELHKSMMGLISAFSEFNTVMNRMLSENAVRDAKKIVDEATQKIEAINQSVKKLDSS
jgi:hypothetical protein